MGMSGSFKGDKPPTKLISGLYHQGQERDPETGERIDGICKHCNQWDAELIDGGCRDSECKQERLRKKVEKGEAVQYTTDVFNSRGKVGTQITRGKKKFFIERE